MLKRISANIAFWGWVVAGASMVIMLLQSGVGYYSNSIYLLPFQEQFGVSRTAISQAFAMMNLIGGFATPWVGLFVDRWGPRKAFLLGISGMALVYALFSQMGAFWQFYALVVLLGISTPLTGLLPAQSLIGFWFIRRRGRAMGLMMAGIGMGGLLLPWLNGLIIEKAGWRVACGMGAGLLLLISLPIAYFLLRDRPEEMGQFPDGASEPPNLSQATTTGATLRQATHTRSFYAMALACGLTYFIIGVMGLHVPAMLRGAGLPLSSAGAIAGVAMGISVVGRLSIGALADRLGSRLVFCMAGLGMGLGALAMLSPASPIARGIYALVYGLSLGGTVTAIPLMVQSYFGMRSFGRIYGIINLTMTVSTALGNYAGGWIFDFSGSYAPAVWLVLGAGALAFLLVLPLRPQRWEPETP